MRDIVFIGFRDKVIDNFGERCFDGLVGKIGQWIKERTEFLVL